MTQPQQALLVTGTVLVSVGALCVVAGIGALVASRNRRTARAPQVFGGVDINTWMKTPEELLRSGRQAIAQTSPPSLVD